MSLYVLANDWFLMMTSDVVPPDPVTVEIVENCQARFRLSVLLDMLSVVRLSSWRVESSSARPVVESRTICRIKSDLICGPEPSVYILGEEVRTVTAIEVTKTTGCPEVRNIPVDESLHPFILLIGLERY